MRRARTSEVIAPDMFYEPGVVQEQSRAFYEEFGYPKPPYPSPVTAEGPNPFMHLQGAEVLRSLKERYPGVFEAIESQLSGPSFGMVMLDPDTGEPLEINKLHHLLPDTVKPLMKAIQPYLIPMGIGGSYKVGMSVKRLQQLMDDIPEAGDTIFTTLSRAHLYKRLAPYRSRGRTPTIPTSSKVPKVDVPKTGKVKVGKGERSQTSVLDRITKVLKLSVWTAVGGGAGTYLWRSFGGTGIDVPSLEPVPLPGKVSYEPLYPSYPSPKVDVEPTLVPVPSPEKVVDVAEAIPDVYPVAESEGWGLPPWWARPSSDVNGKEVPVGSEDKPAPGVKITTDFALPRHGGGGSGGYEKAPLVPAHCDIVIQDAVSSGDLNSVPPECQPLVDWLDHQGRKLSEREAVIGHRQQQVKGSRQLRSKRSRAQGRFDETREYTE
jgi:hypothetical protein